MKSKISIEVDFENNHQPYIRIMQLDSDDVRDQLISSFLQQFGDSSWCKIEWRNPHQFNNETANRIHITPITPHQYKEQSEKMKEEELKNLLAT